MASVEPFPSLPEAPSSSEEFNGEASTDVEDCEGALVVAKVRSFGKLLLVVVLACLTEYVPPRNEQGR